MNLSVTQSFPTLTTEDIGTQFTIANLEVYSNLSANSVSYNIASIDLGNIQSPYWINNSNYNFDTAAINQGKVSINNSGIDMPKDCDIKIGDFSLKESLERIEKQLGILTTNPELEKEWDELKKLGEQYRDLEKKINDKLNVWKILKYE